MRSKSQTQACLARGVGALTLKGTTHQESGTSRSGSCGLSKCRILELRMNPEHIFLQLPTFVSARG